MYAVGVWLFKLSDETSMLIGGVAGALVIITQFVFTSRQPRAR